MGHPYTTYDEYPKPLSDALKRANAWWKYNKVNDTLYITSRNKNQPLTNSEKIKICQYLVMRHHAYKKVHFDD